MKLKDLVKESKYLKREFGEKLPTLDSVMKQHQEESKKPLKEAIAKKSFTTRWGTITIDIDEESGAPGYDPTLLIDVALNKEPLVDMNIQGDPRDNPYDAKVKVFPRKKKIKMRKR